MMGMPEGWYDDPAPANPADPTTMRWWDGNSWTVRVRPATKRERAERREQLLLQRMAMAGAPGSAGGGYLAQPVGLPTSPRDLTSDGQVLAGWWSRVGAAVVDFLVLTVLTLVLAWPWISDIIDAMRVYSLTVQTTQAQAGQLGSAPVDAGPLVHALTGALVAGMLVSWTVKLAYQMLFLKTVAATPGKLAFGLRVRHQDRPGPVSWGAVAGRSVGAFVMAFVPFLYYVDVLWPLWDGRRQTLHDKLAGTLVVRR